MPNLGERMSDWGWGILGLKDGMLGFRGGMLDSRGGMLGQGGRMRGARVECWHSTGPVKFISSLKTQRHFQVVISMSRVKAVFYSCIKLSGKRQLKKNLKVCVAPRTCFASFRRPMVTPWEA